MTTIRPTYQQQEALADFLEENTGIARGFLRTPHAKKETKRKWDTIAVSLNALGGAQKDGKGWDKYWADKKCALKKITAQQAQSIRHTGGGPGDHVPGLSPLDQRLIAIMGGPQFALGDRHLAVNPFPSTSQNVPEVPVMEPSQFFEEDRHLATHTLPSTSQNIPQVSMEIVTPEVVQDVIEVSFSPAQNVPVRDTAPIASTPRPQPSQRRPHTSRSRSNVLDQQKQVFADIERQRVEAERTTTATFSNLVEQLSSYHRSMDDMAAATRESGQIIASAINNAMNNVATALNNIANALQDRRNT